MQTGTAIDGHIKRISAYSFSVLLALVLGATAAVADETAIRSELKLEAARLLEQGDIAGYDQRATELRRTKQKTPAGIWELSLFYKGPDNWPAKQPLAPIWARIEAQTEAYLQQHPDSPSAVVAHARILVTHAWVYRGGDWGRNLSSAQRDGFASYLERARSVLDGHREVGSRDPEWYSLRIQVMNGQDADRESILALAGRALDLEPTYQPVAYVTSNALLPKWGGSVQSLNRFVALAIEKSSGEQGHQAYARIMFNIARGDAKPWAALHDLRVQWPVLRSSLDEIARAYPDPWNWNATRAMACLMGSQADFDAALSRSTPDPVSVAWFDSASTWTECAQRQNMARESPFNRWMQSVLSTPPSPTFVLAGAGGALLAVALVYLTRRRSSAESQPSDSFGSPSSGDGQFPRYYPVSPGWRAGIAGLGAIFCLGAIAGAWALGVIASETRDSPQGLAIAFLLAFVAAGAIIYVVDTMVSTIVLQRDRLEIHELWRVRRIRRSDIEARQTLRPPNGPATLVLTLKSPNTGRIKLPILWQSDALWASWFDQIPDTDMLAAKSFEAAVNSNDQLGATPEERQGRLAKARSIARLSIWVNAGMIAWVFLYPRPYEFLICVLGAAPWIAIAIMAQSPGVYGFNASRNSAQPDLSVLLITPGLLLMLRAITDVQILDWQRLAFCAVLMTLALIGAIVWTLPAAREKPAGVLLMLLVLSAYGYGASALGNALLDRSPITSYSTQVSGKRVTSGRQRTPQLRLAPWGPQKIDSEVSVPWDLYRSVNIGEPICVLVRSGALGVSWYRVAKCGITT